MTQVNETNDIHQKKSPLGGATFSSLQNTPLIEMCLLHQL